MKFTCLCAVAEEKPESHAVSSVAVVALQSAVPLKTALLPSPDPDLSVHCVQMQLESPARLIQWHPLISFLLCVEYTGEFDRACKPIGTP